MHTRLEVHVQVVALAKLQHSAEAVIIDLKHVEQAHNCIVLYALHDAVLTRLCGQSRVSALP